MLRKEFFFIIKKHWLYILVSILVLIMLVDYSPSAKIGIPNVVLLRDNEIESILYEKIKPLFRTQYVETLGKGKSIVAKSMADAFIFVEKDSGIIHIVRNDKSSLSYYVKPLVEQALNESRIKIVYIGKDSSDINKLVNSIYFIFSLICFFISVQLFKDDDKVFDALMLTPITIKRIVLTKCAAVATVLTMMVLCYTIVLGELRVGFMLMFLSIGLIYIAIGILIGIFVNNKLISLLSYPLILLFIILPQIPNSAMGQLNSILENTLISDILPIYVILILLVLFVLMIAFDIWTFDLKTRRSRI